MLWVVNFQERFQGFNSTSFTRLRPMQRSALQAYTDTHLETADLGIEMPTGEGKTLVALLIADYALERGKSVAYLTGTRQLAEHVSLEADKLGMDAVRFARANYSARDLSDYNTAQAVGVMNYWVYFNTNPKPQPADFLILDDAHLAEQPLAKLNSIRIERKASASRELYESLCDVILAHTNTYSTLHSMRDGVAEPNTPPDMIAFMHWLELESIIRQQIQDSPFAESDEGKYVWPRLRDNLARCCAVISESAIEIQPYRPLTTLNPWYRESSNRLYLSATLGSMDDLQRRIGTERIVRLEYESSTTETKTGRRSLILNPTMKGALDPEVLEWALRQVARAGGKATWLCSSLAEADELEERLRRHRGPCVSGSILATTLSCASGCRLNAATS